MGMTRVTYKHNMREIVTFTWRPYVYFDDIPEADVVRAQEQI